MWSAALDAILTTLRYLAPATLLTLFWGQQSFLFRLLKSIDSALRAIVFSSEEQKRAVLQWLAETGQVRVEHLDTVWRHGWIICGVLDAAMPGACAGHPPTRLSLKHAQAIADHYLGVEPVFSRQELESYDALSRHQEWKLATYLERIRQALAKLTPPVSKPVSQRTSPETTQFTLDYVARGSGLSAAQVNNKMYFKIYPTSQQSLDPGEITILIQGPRDTYGMTVLPPIFGKAQMIRQKLLGLQTKPSYTENALPITQGATYLRSYGKNDINKTFYIPKSNYDIEIEEDIREDHIKVGYVVDFEGKHEISIMSRGQNIVGSPFTMRASNNIIGILEKESFCLEDGEEIGIVDVKTDRKVVLRIVDFVTEKMLLKENGSLEKISDEEAKMLMSTNNASKQHLELNPQTYENSLLTTSDKLLAKMHKFKTAANKIIQMNRVCTIIRDLTNTSDSTSAKTFAKQRNHQQYIPDIVNSTFGESNYNPFFLQENQDRFIIPENISVSLRMEKSKYFGEIDDSASSTPMKSESSDSLDQYETLEQQIERDLIASRPMTCSNPFLSDTIGQNYIIEKDLGSFVKSEYETNNSQNEEIQGTSIQIIVEGEESKTPSPLNKNPFIEPDVIYLERPKTPVLKIITGQVENREDSVYVDPKNALISDEILANEFINPFFLHRHESNEHVPITDFIIGAPVSLPPIIRASTPEPDMRSLLITDENKNKNYITTKEHETTKQSINNDDISSVFSTPIHAYPTKIDEVVSSKYHSLDSNASNIEILSLSIASDNSEPEQIKVLHSDRNSTPGKEIWDSAYVSIDDNSSSPDTNNNDNSPTSETPSKNKLSTKDNGIEFSKMGPAEREIWQTCSELIHDAPKTYDDTNPNKCEIKRPTFTPIIEESDRSLPLGMKDSRTSIQQADTDPVTVAFAELNDIYHDYFPNSETSSTIILKEEDMKRNDDSVDSASAISDVKRHAEKLEGKISEVQSSVTESVSASQVLHNIEHEQPLQQFIQGPNKTKFWDTSQRSNIVLERKQYWDERIREIEAKSEENKSQQRRRRLSSKHLRHNDSLSKRRGKQIVKKFLTVNEQNNALKAKNVETEIISAKSPIPQISAENVQTDTKIVEKWKRYWDSKLDIEKDENDVTCFRLKSPKSKESSDQPLKDSHEDIQVYKGKTSVSSPIKQELPEEVFKAFETSPKRFFGTSRKQILNKIDTFLGKSSTADESSVVVSGASPDTGLVSSRISLFHNISHTEDHSRATRKCQSICNISHQKDCEKSTASVDESSIKTSETQGESLQKITFISKDLNQTEQQQNTVTNKIKVTTQNESLQKHNENDRVKIDSKCNTEPETENITLKIKRARMVQKIHNETYDETVSKQQQDDQYFETSLPNVKGVIQAYNKQSQCSKTKLQNNTLRKTSKSKSEMDIFKKLTNAPYEDDLDKYKSCDELPKTRVKNFISLYESVSKTDVEPEPDKRNIQTNFGLQKPLGISLSSGTVNTTQNNIVKTTATKNYTRGKSNIEQSHIQRNRWANTDAASISTASADARSFESLGTEISSTQNVEKEITDKESTYLSLSDIELEIIENLEHSETSPEREIETAHIDYKSRFKLAKQYFQSLEELREEKKPQKLNECELLLTNKSSTESLETERPKKRAKKNIKAHSMPSNEISKIWNQLQNIETKLVKISEKFNVDDLFMDVMEGKLSRQGSLRGIPNKKAVLETFKSMENLTDSKLSPYEIAATQLSDFAKENQIKTAQTCLTEYPYLPTTDPSKYHSRLDTKATGLISFKELTNQKPRRNSVPELNMNSTFTVDL